MAYKRIYLDSDVLLDLILYRQPYFAYTQLLVIERDKREIDLYTSALVIANMHYIISKSIGSKLASERLKGLMKFINILPFEADIISTVLDSSFADFEDGIQHFIARRYKCEAIVTRNIKDYKHSIIPVFTTEQFLNSFK